MPSIAGFPVTPDVYSRTISIIFIALFTIVLAHLARYAFKRTFRKPFHLPGGKPFTFHDKTRYRFTMHVVVAIIYVVGIALIIGKIPELHTLSVSLLAGAGVLAAIVGFAAQKTFSNIIAGVFIAIFEPFKVGDKVIINDNFGTIQDITLGHTVVQTWDHRNLIVPNSRMSEEMIENWTYDGQKILKYVDVGISYDSDIDLARRILQEEAVNHENFYDVHQEDPLLAAADKVTVRVTDWADSAIRMRLYFWAPDPATGYKMRCDILESVKKRFDKEGVEIPWPYRTIAYKKDLKKPKRLRRR